MIPPDEVPTLLVAMESVADAFSTDSVVLLNLLAPDMERSTIEQVAVAMGCCPVHLSLAEVCADDGCHELAQREEVHQ